MDGDLDQRYFCEPAAAYIRGKLPSLADLPFAELFRIGLAAGLKLHRPGGS